MERKEDYMSVQVFIPIDEATKQQFDHVCEVIGISPSNALGLFIQNVINGNGIPLEKDVRSKKSKRTREEMFGSARGRFNIPDDFNDPLEDFKEYME